MNLIYSNIELTKQLDKSNCITHSGKFHVNGKFCCTKTLESAIKLIFYNES